jgi:hypothetical protein
LKAGISEEGQWLETKVGTPQGSVASPLLANIYQHYVFDLWVEAWRKKVAKGEVVVVRYADDRVPRAQRAERAVSAANCRGSGCSRSWIAGFPHHGFCIPIPMRASLPHIQGKSRMH